MSTTKLDVAMLGQTKACKSGLDYERASLHEGRHGSHCSKIGTCGKDLKFGMSEAIRMYQIIQSVSSNRHIPKHRRFESELRLTARQGTNDENDAGTFNRYACDKAGAPHRVVN